MITVVVVVVVVVVVFPLLLLACYYLCPSTAIKSKLLLDLRGVLLACISSYVIVEGIINESVVRSNISAVDTTRRRSVINNPKCSDPY